MSVNVYSICWNEEFLLPYFLKHYSWANKIIIYDNGSTDNSIEIIKNHPKAELRHYETNNEQDNQTMVDLKNNCWKGDSSDWVIVCDIDEWLIDTECLKSMSGKVVFKPEGWQMVGSGEPIEAINRAYRDMNFDKMVCFSPRIKEINYAHGCHRAYPVDGSVINRMRLLHYNFISEEYMVKRWQRYVPRMSAKDKMNKWGGQYMSPEEDLRRIYRSGYETAIKIL